MERRERTLQLASLLNPGSPRSLWLTFISLKGRYVKRQLACNQKFGKVYRQAAHLKKSKVLIKKNDKYHNLKNCCLKEPGLVQLTPGVHLSQAGDNKDQE